MKIIGIDPGLSGAIAILKDNKVIDIFDMPVMSEGKKNKKQLNSAQLVNIINENTEKNEEIFVVVEQVNALSESVYFDKLCAWFVQHYNYLFWPSKWKNI